MSIAELLKPAAGLTPEERYVLVRLAFRAYASEPLDVGSKMLAKYFGMPDTAFTKAKGGLIEHGILFESGLAASSGRPRTQLKWAEEWNHELMTELVSRTPHLDVILTLLGSCSRASMSGKVIEARMATVRATRSSEKISFVNCILLVVLWAHADRFGVVEGVGAKLLSTLTGLNKESLKHRLGRLVEQGFICHVIPGGYSRILGGRLDSVYVLNCSHPIVSGAGGLPELLDYSSVRSQRASRDHWDWTLHHHQERVRQLDRDPQGYGDDPWGRYHWVLRREGSDVYFRQLPLRLCEYACIILESGIERLKHSELHRVLKPLIRADFQVPKPSDGELWRRSGVPHDMPEPSLRVVLDEDGSLAELSDMARVICRYVLQVVQVLRACVRDETLPGWANCRIIWLPHISGDEGFIVLRSRA